MSLDCACAHIEKIHTFFSWRCAKAAAMQQWSLFRIRKISTQLKMKRPFGHKNQ